MTESLVSLLIKPSYEIAILASIPSWAFTPVPRVDIVLAAFICRAKPLVSTQHAQWYRDFIVYTFRQWKPSLLESLSKLFSSTQLRRIGQRLKITGLTLTQVPFETWLKLFADFMSLVSEEKKRLVVGAEAMLKKDQSQLLKQYRTGYRKR